MCETHALRVTIQRFLLLKISSRMESSAVVALALLPPFARTIKSKRTIALSCLMDSCTFTLEKCNSNGA
ncbi:hypothetical protein RHMOL_Rhmol06G0087300 [Rhododendron molle]|uniref:Uncharacterized protein n=1 Tax=Rhododendron molle TaxID=49168 RepID=A0ACC0NC55_RHOML|nr:hypothetical protein RHMOL_Rhmol06G0087300 [Rhododendron molle]